MPARRNPGRIYRMRQIEVMVARPGRPRNANAQPSFADFDLDPARINAGRRQADLVASAVITDQWLLGCGFAAYPPARDQQIVEQLIENAFEFVERGSTCRGVASLRHASILTFRGGLRIGHPGRSWVAHFRAGPLAGLPKKSARRIVRFVPTFTKILAATDFSDDSNYALSYAVELAQKFSAEVIVLHVDQPLAPVMVSELNPGLDVSAMNRIAEEQRLAALRELDQTTARLRESGLKARGLLKVGAPFLEIVTTAQAEGADLIVMGTHGRSGLAHVLMGSVAERVVRKAGCPVLTVRHPDRKFKHPLEK